MNVLWKHFDGIFCINIAERKDRYISSKQEFEKLNLNVQYHVVSRHENGDQGCFESHTDICRKALELDYKRIIIFEDDIEVLSNFTSDIGLNILCFMKNTKWNVFYLGCFPINKYKSYRSTHNNIYKVRAVGAHAYAINRPQIEYLASLRWDGKPYDSYLTSTYHYAYLPSLFTQKAYKSDIERSINIINNFPKLKYFGLYINERYTMYISNPIDQTITLLSITVILLVAIFFICLKKCKNK